MIDRLILTVSDHEASNDFCRAALKPLGSDVVAELGRGRGLGVAEKPDVWTHQAKPLRHRPVSDGPPDRHGFESGARREYSVS